MSGKVGGARGQEGYECHDDLGRSECMKSKKKGELTQKVCSQRKLGCLLQAQRPRVTNPLLASSSVHLSRAPIHSFPLYLRP